MSNDLIYFILIKRLFTMYIRSNGFVIHNSSMLSLAPNEIVHHMPTFKAKSDAMCLHYTTKLFISSQTNGLSPILHSPLSLSVKGEL